MGLPPGESAQSPEESARPATGDGRVDEAVARLVDLAELPVAEHPAVFEYLHERLTEALGDLDVRDQAKPGGQGQGAGQGHSQGHGGAQRPGQWQGQGPRPGPPPGRPGG